MNVLNEYAVEVFNVKKATFDGNYFGVTVKSPVIYFDYDENIVTGCDWEDDISSSEVNNTFENNVSKYFNLIILHNIINVVCNFRFLQLLKRIFSEWMIKMRITQVDLSKINSCLKIMGF